MSSFFHRREERLFDLIEDYTETVVEAVRRLRRLMEAVKKGELGKLSIVYGEIDGLETEADAKRKQISEELCKGTFFSHLREDLLNLVEEIDNLADWAKDAAKIMVETTPSWELLHFVFTLSDMDRYIDSCVKASEKLLEALKILRRSGKKATPLLHEIEDIEEEADDLKMNLTRSLLREAGRFNLIDVIQMKEMIYLLDNVCDSAEDASDRILLIIAKGYG